MIISLSFFTPRYLSSISVLIVMIYFSFKIPETLLCFCFYYPKHEINLTLISHDVTDFSYTQAN